MRRPDEKLLKCAAGGARKRVAPGLRISPMQAALTTAPMMESGGVRCLRQNLTVAY
jgi:hypothetical protein